VDKKRYPPLADTYRPTRPLTRSGPKSSLCSPKSRGKFFTLHPACFYHLWSATQNHARKDATRQQAGKSLQAEPWASEQRSCEAAPKSREKQNHHQHRQEMPFLSETSTPWGV